MSWGALLKKLGWKKVPRKAPRSKGENFKARLDGWLSFFMNVLVRDYNPKDFLHDAPRFGRAADFFRISKKQAKRDWEEINRRSRIKDDKCYDVCVRIVEAFEVAKREKRGLKVRRAKAEEIKNYLERKVKKPRMYTTSTSVSFDENRDSMQGSITRQI